jgi:hypothetical protein
MAQEEKILRVDMNSLPNIHCKSCESTHFRQIFRIKSVPALLSQTGQPGYIMVPCYLCDICDAELDLNMKPQKPN